MSAPSFHPLTGSGLLLSSKNNHLLTRNKLPLIWCPGANRTQNQSWDSHQPNHFWTRNAWLYTLLLLFLHIHQNFSNTPKSGIEVMAPISSQCGYIWSSHVLASPPLLPFWLIDTCQVPLESRSPGSNSCFLRDTDSDLKVEFSTLNSIHKRVLEWVSEWLDE